MMSISASWIIMSAYEFEKKVLRFASSSFFVLLFKYQAYNPFKASEFIQKIFSLFLISNLLFLSWSSGLKEFNISTL